MSGEDTRQPSTLGERVAAARRSAGLSRSELAAAASAAPDPLAPDVEDPAVRIRLLGASVAEDAMALRITADTVYVAAMSGHGSNAAYHVCRALALGLRTIERDAMRATKPGWKPVDDNHPLDDPCIDGEEDA